MLEELTIFDIPIYLMSEHLYEKRIEEICEVQSQNYSRTEIDYFEEKTWCISNHNSGFPWRYNLIVGSIKITISNEESIELELYFIDEKWVKPESKQKHIIKKVHINDLRIKNILTLNYTDEELKKRLNEKLNFIIKNFVNNRSHKYYVDLEIYNNLIKYINLKNLVLEMNAK